jgi:hypothetical protein
MKTPDDMTASQRALMRKLYDAGAGEWTFLIGSEKRVAWNLARDTDFIFIGVGRAGDPKGEPTKLTREGRSWWTSFLNPFARGR